MGLSPGEKTFVIKSCKEFQAAKKAGFKNLPVEVINDMKMKIEEFSNNITGMEQSIEKIDRAIDKAKEKVTELEELKKSIIAVRQLAHKNRKDFEILWERLFGDEPLPNLSTEAPSEPEIEDAEEDIESDGSEGEESSTEDQTDQE